MNAYLIPGIIRTDYKDLIGLMYSVPFKDPDSLIEFTTEFWQVNKGDLLSNKKNSENLILGRHLCAFLLYHKLGLNFEQVAIIMNKKSHATIINSEKTIKNLWDTDKRFKKSIVDFYYKAMMWQNTQN